MADQPILPVVKFLKNYPGAVIDADAKRHNEQVLEARRLRQQQQRG
jgi:hypothetical protein